MASKWITRIVSMTLLASLAAGTVWALQPQPVPVDLAVIARGPLEVTVDEEGKTRVQEIYTISAPVTGKLVRAPREVGDEVVANETVVAILEPAPPSFLDTRSRHELEAAVRSAEAAVKLAEAEVRRMEASLDYTRLEFRRAQSLIRTETVAQRTLDRARLEVETSEAALASARATLDVRRSERESAAARLIEPDGASTRPRPVCCVSVRAPVTGRVLRIMQESETVVQVGAPLIEIGDPADLEIVVELLSTDAVRVQPGSSVSVDGWGGRGLRGRVRRVDPAGFVKISALGIEEQRVRTVIDFSDPRPTWSRLGHDFRVVTHIVVWRADQVLTVRNGALFRQGEDWAVFVVSNGRARLTTVRIGQRNQQEAEVLAGLAPGDQVVVHPSDRVRDGSRIIPRD